LALTCETISESQKESLGFGICGILRNLLVEIGMRNELVGNQGQVSRATWNTLPYPYPPPRVPKGRVGGGNVRTPNYPTLWHTTPIRGSPRNRPKN